MSNRELIASLQPGDIVEIARADRPEHPVTGQAVLIGDALYVGPYLLRKPDMEPHPFVDFVTMKVVKRPDQLFVNHPRQHFALGDLVQDANGPGGLTYYRADDGSAADWVIAGRARGQFDWVTEESLPPRLTLLVDGETGQVVQ